MAYITLGQLKSYKGITSDTDDVLLAGFIASAQSTIDDLHGQTFEATADATRYFDAKADVWGRKLVLDRPLCQITSVTNGDGVAILPASYVTEPRNGTPYWALTLKATADVFWTWGNDPENAITVVGRWAYSLTAPADIQQKTLQLAAWLYLQKDTSAEIERPILTTGGTVLLPQRLPADLVVPGKRRGGAG